MGLPCLPVCLCGSSGDCVLGVASTVPRAFAISHVSSVLLEPARKASHSVSELRRHGGPPVGGRLCGAKRSECHSLLELKRRLTSECSTVRPGETFSRPLRLESRPERLVDQSESTHVSDEPSSLPLPKPQVVTCAVLAGNLQNCGRRIRRQDPGVCAVLRQRPGADGSGRTQEPPGSAEGDL